MYVYHGLFLRLGINARVKNHALDEICSLETTYRN